uniref:extra-large guanine nucleotide-binding protein 1-like n=1 Tax=Erigeron canadensis TaxID=72917 RepID=UPI001CB9837C|nr:extra-large guanine nucleotide-binding protein 1-like [Erigeron canadensis]
MGSIFRSILPICSSKKDVDDDEYNLEYSFATDYIGPLVSCAIPKAVPVNVGDISTASIMSTPANSGNLSLPVIYLLVKREGKFFSLKGSRLGSGSIDNDAYIPGSPEGEKCSVSLGFSESQENSQDFSMSSDVDGLGNDCHEIEDLHDTSEEDGTNEEIPNYNDTTHMVTFREPESSGMVHEESYYSSEPRIMHQERPHADPNVKKWLCHRCFKGNRFTIKESCIVCDAKYCSKCVLRVMGSMQEGRKCISCVGYPIDESKRAQLGKCSKVLKQVLSDFQAKQVMLFEKSCQVNQAPYWLVIVNGKPLTLEEVIELQTCAYPPKKLVPGCYWYDKLSGLWGKEGYKPRQIITPGMSIGGSIMENASNGNTKVKLNNRVITKAELFLLKFAGINWKGEPEFRVSHNGSYQVVGQNQRKGNIWAKSGINFCCALLSLPVPPKSFISSEKELVNNGCQFGQKIATDTKSLTKILLVGKDQSGTSAIYKHAKILYKVPFSEDERQEVKSLIQNNLYRYISILLEGLQQFEEDYSSRIERKLDHQRGSSATGGLFDEVEENIYSSSTKLKKFSEWLLQVKRSGNLDVVFAAAAREHSVLVEELWKDKAFQATYARRNELRALPIAADYFLPRAPEILSMTYEPSDMDILYVDGITSSNGLASMEFSVPSTILNSDIEATEQNNTSPQRYQLIRVNSSNLGHNCKYLDMFEDIDLIIYCVDLTSYNEYTINNNLFLKNKMLESKDTFEKIVTHPRFKNKAFLLILNKFDLLENKIKTAPLTQCEWFHDFKPSITNHTYSATSSKSNTNSHNTASVAEYGFQYIAAKFKKLFSELTGRKLYVSPVTGLEGDSVDAAIRYGKDVLMWVDEENKSISSNNEWSTQTTETTLEGHQK